METFSSELVLKALDGLTARSIATAQNIANAGTKAYRPVRVSFERALAAAAGQGVEAVRAVRPMTVADVQSSSGGDLRLDLELATASSTALRYAALVEVLNRQLQLDAIAVTGNG